jgi:hypothetical protein
MAKEYSQVHRLVARGIMPHRLLDRDVLSSTLNHHPHHRFGSSLEFITFMCDSHDISSISYFLWMSAFFSFDYFA